MRIVIDGLSARIGGGVTYLRNLVPELIRLGGQHSYVVVVRHELADRVARGSPSDNVSVVRVRVRSTLHRLALEQVWLPGVLRRLGADLVYGPAELIPLVAPCPAVVACRNPNLYTDRDVGWPSGLRMHFAMLRALAIPSIRRARRVISVSDAWCEPIARTAHIGRERISVVPHGVSEAFRQLGQARLAEGGGALDNRAWLSVSTIYRYKNYDTLLESMALLRERGVRLQMRIVGGDADPSHSRRLRQRLRARGLESQVQLLGAVDYESVRRFYAAASGFVFPSWLETFGHPLLEAMAAGVPAVAADTPVFRELAGDTVLYADPFDAAALAAAMEAVARDGAASVARARRALERSAAFSWLRTATLTREVFEQAADARLSPAPLAVYGAG